MEIDIVQGMDRCCTSSWLNAFSTISKFFSASKNFIRFSGIQNDGRVFRWSFFKGKETNLKNTNRKEPQKLLANLKIYCLIFKNGLLVKLKTKNKKQQKKHIFLRNFKENASIFKILIKFIKFSFLLINYTFANYLFKNKSKKNCFVSFFETVSMIIWNKRIFILKTKLFFWKFCKNFWNSFHCFFFIWKSIIDSFKNKPNNKFLLVWNNFVENLIFKTKYFDTKF